MIILYLFCYNKPVVFSLEEIVIIVVNYVHHGTCSTACVVLGRTVINVAPCLKYVHGQRKEAFVREMDIVYEIIHLSFEPKLGQSLFRLLSAHLGLGLRLWLRRSGRCWHLNSLVYFNTFADY